MSQYISPFLQAYELEKAEGISIGLEQFQHNIKRKIPKGHTFKAFPIQFAHFRASTIMLSCGRDQLCSEILNARGLLRRRRRRRSAP